MNHLLAFEHFKNTDSYNIEPFVEWEAGGQVEYFLFIFPWNLKVQQLNSSNKLIYQSLCLCICLDIRVNDSYKLIVVEERQILYYFCFYFAHDINAVILFLFDIISIVHYHLDKTRQRDVIKIP